MKMLWKIWAEINYVNIRTDDTFCMYSWKILWKQKDVFKTMNIEIQQCIKFNVRFVVAKHLIQTYISTSQNLFQNTAISLEKAYQHRLHNNEIVQCMNIVNFLDSFYCCSQDYAAECQTILHDKHHTSNDKAE